MHIKIPKPLCVNLTATNDAYDCQKLISFARKAKHDVWSCLPCCAKGALPSGSLLCVWPVTSVPVFECEAKCVYWNSNRPNNRGRLISDLFSTFNKCPAGWIIKCLEPPSDRLANQITFFKSYNQYRHCSCGSNQLSTLTVAFALPLDLRRRNLAFHIAERQNTRTVAAFGPSSNLREDSVLWEWVIIWAKSNNIQHPIH